MTICVHHLDAFTDNNTGGNPAGVVLDADSLTESQMQAIAAKVGFSETAFVSKHPSCDFQVRFFTPNSEVDFCGHATLSVFSLLFQLDVIHTGSYVQQTKAGQLAVTVSSSGYVEMTQTLPKFLGEIPSDEVAATLNVPTETLMVNQLPVEIVSTGLADIMVPIKTGQLDSITPDLAQIAILSKKYNALGYHLFELSDGNEANTASCRNFAPLVGIDEESATGSACGALASYLCKHQVISGNAFVFEQGRAMRCRSKIKAKVETTENEVTRVLVGGYANRVKEISV